jgi:hypothetical protein
LLGWRSEARANFVVCYRVSGLTGACGTEGWMGRTNWKREGCVRRGRSVRVWVCFQVLLDVDSIWKTIY